MERREALRLLATAAALPLVPGEMRALLRAARAQTAGAASPGTLSPHHDQLVVALTEIILPQTGTAGAKAAKVNEFIDLILTEWCDDDERQRFLAGLADVDARSTARFGKDFLASSAEQQVALVRELDDEMASQQLALRNGDEAVQKALEQAPNFFGWLKELTLTGYYTSEVGATQELHFEMMPGSYQGCVPVTPNPRSS